MEAERVHNPFTYENNVYIVMSEEELRVLRLDLSLAAAYMQNLDAIRNFLYDTDHI